MPNKDKKDEFEDFFSILKTIEDHQYWIVEDPDVLWQWVESYGKEMYEKGREGLGREVAMIITDMELGRGVKEDHSQIRLMTKKLTELIIKEQGDGN